MDSLVDNQGLLIPTGLPTVGAPQRLVGVRSLMGVQFVLGGKAFPTVGALIRPVSRVAPLMDIKLPFPQEAFPTLRALEGFVSSVDPPVLAEVPIGSEAGPAL